MKVPSNIDSVPGPHKGMGQRDPIADKIWKRFRNVYHQLQKAVNGNIEYGNPTAGSANINGRWVQVTTPGVANTDFTVTHNLGRAVAGYIVMQKNGSVDIYTSPTANANPNTQFILRATVINITVVLFFV